MNQRNVTIIKGMLANFLQTFPNKELESSFRASQAAQYTLQNFMSTFLIALVAIMAIIQIIIDTTDFKTFIILPVLLLLFLIKIRKTRQNRENQQKLQENQQKIQFSSNFSKQMSLIHLIFALGVIISSVFFIDALPSDYQVTMGYISGGLILVYLSDLSLLWYAKFMIELLASVVLLFLPENGENNQNELFKLLIFLPFQVLVAMTFYQNERIRRQEFMNGVTKSKHILTWEKLISDAFPSPAFILNYGSTAAALDKNDDKELGIPFWNKAFTKLMSEIDPSYNISGSPKRNNAKNMESREGSPVRSQPNQQIQQTPQFKPVKRSEFYTEKKEESHSRSVKEHSSAKEIIIIRNSSVKILSSVSYNEIPSPIVMENDLEYQGDVTKNRAKTPKHDRAAQFISVKALRENTSQKSVEIREMASAPVIRQNSISGFLSNFVLLKDKLSQETTPFGGIEGKRPQITAENLPSFLQRIACDLDPTSPLNNSRNNSTMNPLNVQINSPNVPSIPNIFPSLIPGQILQEKKVMIRIPGEEPKVFDMRICSCNWAEKPSALVIFNDQTDRIINEKLKRLDEYKDTVLSTVSHDFRTPLNIMIQLLEGMIASYEAPASAPSSGASPKHGQGAPLTIINAKEDLQLCNSSANLLLSYVNDILDLAQMRQQKLKINKAMFDVSKTLEQVVKLLSFQATAKKISLYLDNQLENFPKSPRKGSLSPSRKSAAKTGLFIYNDERRLKQILINLIGNALKFTSNGHIRLSAKLSHKHGGTLKFSVEDTGCGIKREDLHKLFKPYSKLKPSEKANKNGVGLGLVICKNFVSLMGPLKGLKVKSAPGVGSKFVFYIYYKDQHAIQYDIEENQNNNNNNNVMISKKHQEEDDLMMNNSIDEMGFGGSELLNRALPQLPSVPYMSDERVIVDINHLGEKTPIQPSMQMQYFASDGPSPSFAGLPTPTIPVDSPKRLEKLEKQAKTIKILAVDDHPFNLMALEKALQIASQAISCTVELIMTYNGLEALQVMKEQKADLVLLDCEMPIMNGYECASQLTKLMKSGELKTVPIIAMTAHQSENERLKCVKSGMNGFITKPAPYEELQKVMERVILEKTSEELMSPK